mgnify:CR=1 FL=1
MDTTKTMRQLCADEPKLEAFLQSKGFPFRSITPLLTWSHSKTCARCAAWIATSFWANLKRIRPTYKRRCGVVVSSGKLKGFACITWEST